MPVDLTGIEESKPEAVDLSGIEGIDLSGVEGVEKKTPWYKSLFKQTPEAPMEVDTVPSHAVAPGMAPAHEAVQPKLPTGLSAFSPTAGMNLSEADISKAAGDVGSQVISGLSAAEAPHGATGEWEEQPNIIALDAKKKTIGDSENDLLARKVKLDEIDKNLAQIKSDLDSTAKNYPSGLPKDIYNDYKVKVDAFNGLLGNRNNIAAEFSRVYERHKGLIDDYDSYVRLYDEAKSAKTADRPGVFGAATDVASAISRGVVGGVGMGARALRLGDTPESSPKLTAVSGWAEDAGKSGFLRPSKQAEAGGVRGVIPAAFESAAESITASVPAMAAGTAVGGPVGAAIGFAAGAGTVFGAEKYDQVIQDARKQGLIEKLNKQGVDGEALIKDKAIYAALVEGGVEFAGNLAIARIAKLLPGANAAAKNAVKDTIRQIFKTSPLEIAKRAGKSALTETAEETVQSAWGGSIEKSAGLKREDDDGNLHEIDPWREARASMAPAAGAGILFSLLGTSMGAVHKRGIIKKLYGVNASPGVRAEAVREVAKTISQVNENPLIARNWRDNALKSIERGEPVSVDELLASYNYMIPGEAQSEKAATPEETFNNALADIKNIAAGKPVAAKVAAQQADASRGIQSEMDAVNLQESEADRAKQKQAWATDEAGRAKRREEWASRIANGQAQGREYAQFLQDELAQIEQVATPEKSTTPVAPVAAVETPAAIATPAIPGQETPSVAVAGGIDRRTAELSPMRAKTQEILDSEKLRGLPMDAETRQQAVKAALTGEQNLDADLLSVGDTVVKRSESTGEIDTFKVTSNDGNKVKIKDGTTEEFTASESIPTLAVSKAKTEGVPENIKTELESRGMTINGVQEGAGSIPAGVLFTDPQTKSTLMVGMQDFTPEKLDAHIEASRAKFAAKQGGKTEQPAASIATPSTITDSLAAGSPVRIGRNPQVHSKEALPKLIELGQGVLQSGKTKFFDFRNAMKSHLGDMWDKFKHLMEKVYFAAKKANRELGDKLSNERGVFVGPKAKGFSEAQGKFSDLADKQERIELDDEGAKWKSKYSIIEKISNSSRGSVYLSEILDHPALYEAYPDAKNIRVALPDPFKDMTAGASYNTKTDTITVNSARPYKEHLSSILHEIQHAIQEREGFASGSSIAASVDNASETKAKFDALTTEHDALKEKPFAQRTPRENTRLRNLASEIRDMAESIVSETNRNYMLSSGEEEARRVSARADMTQAERMGTPYDRTDLAPGEERIVRRGGGVAESRETSNLNPFQREQDREYLQAVASGDLATAQKMVDEAAKRAGYTVGPVYHWTDNDFNEFSMEASGGMAHFGTRQAAIDRASGQLNIGYDVEKDGNEFLVFADSGPMSGEGQGPFKTEIEAKAFAKKQPKTIEPMRLFLDIKNPLRVPDLGVWTFDGIRSHLSRENIITDKEADRAWAAWKQTDQKGWDALNSILEKKGYDGFVYTNEQEDKGSDSYVALNPNQIKSADPITRDDQGDVIPLSKRFNKKSSIILYSGIPIDVLVNDLKKLSPVAKEAYDKLVDIGHKVYADGAKNYVVFSTSMKRLLGDAWSSFKGMIFKAFHAIRDANKRLGQSGALGEGPISREEARRRWEASRAKMMKKAEGVRPKVEEVKAKEEAASVNAENPRNSVSWTEEPSKMDSFIRTMQDKHIDTKRVIAAIKKQVGEIADKFNVYMQEELFHGRTAKKTSDFLEQEIRPLMQEMAKRKIAIADFEEYLHARHAQEANETIAKRNPDNPDMQDGGSGMDTADAQAYLSSLTPENMAAFEALAKKVDAINKETRQTWVEYGLTAQSDVDAMESAYKYYVPLHREDMERGPGIGQGFSVRGPVSKRRTGSKRAVVDILANIASQREKAIIRGEKNRVSTALVGLAFANPNKDFWKVDQPPKIKTLEATVYPWEVVSKAKVEGNFLTKEDAQDFAETIPGSVARKAAKPYVEERVVSMVDPLYKSKENVIIARIPNKKTGIIEEHSVMFNETNERAVRMAAALKNLDADEISHLLGLSAKATRYFASINTQYNPVFGVINLMRDVQSGMLNLSATPLAGKQPIVLKHTVSALRGIYSDIRKKRSGKAPTSQWAQLWEEFQAEGGQTGYRDMFKNSQERGEALQREIKRAMAGKMRMAGRAVMNWLSDYNTVSENAVRLATYKTAIDAGMSKMQAASIAKNLTVNFNRKGQIARQAGSLYAFFNASAQGTARMVETLKGPAGKKIIAGGILLGAMDALMLAAFGFDDDEPPGFIRERSFVIPIGGKKYISIPMPQGFLVLPNLGRLATELLLPGRKDVGKKVTSFAGTVVDAFNPIGGSGLSMQTIAPTVLDPFAALAENRDWTGRPISRPDYNSLNPTPGHTRTKDTASEISKQLSRAINWLSGGTEYQPGVVSPTPDQIDYLIGQATGGVGRELNKVATSTTVLASGEDLPPHKIPLFGRLYGNAASQSAEGSRFYENIILLNKHQNEIEGRLKDGKDIDDYLEAHPEAGLYRLANDIERDVKRFRKLRKELLDDNADKSEIRDIDEMITERMAFLNESVKSANANDDIELTTEEEE